jgi:hypothetical protein
MRKRNGQISSSLFFKKRNIENRFERNHVEVTSGVGLGSF